MSDKHFIGKRLFSFSDNGLRDPVSRVTLLVDDENSVTAGDDTGLELLANCPYADETLAQALLNQVKGYQYRAFNAQSADLDPAAELGDGITADGVYSILAGLTDNGDGYPDISAPGDREEEDEYPDGGPLTRLFNRQLAATRSLISKTAEQIRLEVQGVENEISYIQLDLDKITSRVEDAEGNISTLEQTAKSLRSEINGKIDGDYAQTLIDQTLEGIELSVSSSGGSTTFKLMAGSAELSTKTLNLSVDAVNITGKLTASQIDATNLKVNAANITGTLYIGDLEDDVGLVTERNVTKITQYAIETAELSADQIVAGTLDADYINMSGAFRVKLNGSTYGYVGASEFGDTSGAVLCNSTTQNGVLCTNTGAQLIYGAGGNDPKKIWVASGGCYSNYTMQVWSDRRLKKNISYDLSQEEVLFTLLRACSFEMSNDVAGKKRWGFIAQQVIEAAKEAGMDFSKLAIISEDQGRYSLGYGEVTALNTHMIQKLMARVAALEGARA